MASTSACRANSFFSSGVSVSHLGRLSGYVVSLVCAGMKHCLIWFAQLLAQAAPGRLDAEVFAQIIGVPRRTMTQQLADEGGGFRLLLEAEQLGYQDVTSLRCTMARWAHGKS